MKLRLNSPFNSDQKIFFFNFLKNLSANFLFKTNFLEKIFNYRIEFFFKFILLMFRRWPPTHPGGTNPTIWSIILIFEFSCFKIWQRMMRSWLLLRLVRSIYLYNIYLDTSHIRSEVKVRSIYLVGCIYLSWSR